MSKGIAAPIPSGGAGTPLWAVKLTQEITGWVQGLLSAPIRLPSYTVATVPAADSFMNCAIIVSNESGGRTIATSDGTHWKRVKDGANIS